MMRIETMKFVTNQFERDERTVIHELIKNWNHDEQSLKLGRVSPNFIFYFKENEQWRVLRVVRDDDRSFKMIKAELNFILHLQKENIPAVGPLNSLNNNFLESFKVADGLYHAVAFNRVHGKHIQYYELSNDRLFKWGKGLAELHEATKKYHPVNDHIRPTWEEEIELALKTYPEEDKLISDKLIILKEWIDSLELTKENSGLIHYDFELDNLLWENGSYKIIDFDDCAYYPFIADIAFGIPDVLESDLDRKEHILNKFIEGYTSILELPSIWREELNQFYKLMLFLKYARVLRSYRDANPSTDLEWTAKMRVKHMDWLVKRKRKLEEI